jgi:hypothetical protein
MLWRRQWRLVVALAVAVAPSLARTQPIATDTLGSGLVIPYLTSGSNGERMTIATVTNARMGPINLHVVAVSGDAGESCEQMEVECALTPLETTYLVFENDGAQGANLTIECSEPGQMGPDGSGTATNLVRIEHLWGEDGFLFITLECQEGDANCLAESGPDLTLFENALMGDATVFNPDLGTSYSVSAIPIQSGASPEPRECSLFDGIDYRSFPELLVADYIAPVRDESVEPPEDLVSAKLLLFTLDFTPGQAGIQASVAGTAFDDDENATSGNIDLDCFEEIDLTDVFGAAIRGDTNGSLVGHLELRPIETAATDGHESNPIVGNRSGRRVRPIHGWIVQQIAEGAFLGPTQPPAGLVPSGPFPGPVDPIPPDQASACMLVEPPTPENPTRAQCTMEQPGAWASS